MSFDALLGRSMRKEHFLYGTTNAGKLAEIKVLAERYEIDLIGLGEIEKQEGLSQAPAVLENGVSYEENAALKAKAYASWSGRSCFADDSGLEIDCLEGLPGVFTARFGFERVRKMLNGMRNVEARLICCVAYAEPSGRSVAVTKSLAGNVELGLADVKAKETLPFSYVFIPKGQSLSLANLLATNDSATVPFLSHRGQAVLSLLRALS